LSRDYATFESNAIAVGLSSNSPSPWVIDSDLEQILADDHRSPEVHPGRVDPHLICEGRIVCGDEMGEH